MYASAARGSARWITVCADYCVRHRLEVVAVARRLEDALGQVTGGHADVLVCIAADDVFPVIQFVTQEMNDPDDPMTRRPQLLRTSRVDPREDGV